MTEHKYESDMTSREKRQQEREKIAAMNWKEKIDYFITYYKWVLVVIIIVIMLGAVARQMYVSLNEETLLDMAILNAGQGDREKFMEDVRKVLGAEKDNQVVKLDTSLFGGDDAQNEYNRTMKLTAVVSSETLEVLICDKEIFDQYSQEGMFLDMEELMGPVFYEEHEGEVGEDYVRVENSRLSEEYGLLDDGEYYLGVFYYTDHAENARKFIEYIFE